MKKEIDFIIVGAPKAGTTSLAAYLGESPQIYIPPEKEIPYFLHTRMQEKGWDWYFNTYFHHADPRLLWGTSTPQYMIYPETFKQIKETLPDVKIIVTLRDPVARLISHFDMVTRFGAEKRSLNEAVEDQLLHIDHYRGTPYNDKTGKYIAIGEYGRILHMLYQHFDRGEVLVVDFNDIRQDAQQVVGCICDFLDIESFVPGNLTTVRMKGGSRKKFAVDHDRIISVLANFSKSIGLESVISDRFKARVGRLSSWLDDTNVDPSSKSRITDLSDDLLKRLHEHYRSDAVLLESLGIKATWIKDWQGLSK